MHFGRKKTLIDRAHDYVEQISDTVLPQLEAAWEQAVEKAGPAISDARDKATPLIAEGKALAAEKASAGAALAAEKASVGRDLAAAKVADLKGEPEPKRGKLKKFLLFSGLLAIGGVVLSKLKARNESANWQSSYVPTPRPTPPAPPAPAAPAKAAATKAKAAPKAAASEAKADPLTDPLPDEAPASDDTGGGAPGEAISDSVEEPQESTTPDDPAEIIDIDDVPQKQGPS